MNHSPLCKAPNYLEPPLENNIITIRLETTTDLYTLGYLVILKNRTTFIANIVTILKMLTAIISMVLLENIMDLEPTTNMTILTICTFLRVNIMDQGARRYLRSLPQRRSYTKNLDAYSTALMGTLPTWAQTQGAGGSNPTHGRATTGTQAGSPTSICGRQRTR